MPFVTHMSTAVPNHTLAQTVAATVVARSLGLENVRARVVQDLFERSQVRRRFCVLPPAELAEARTLSANMDLYRRHATELALRAARSCLARANLDPKTIDMVVSCSCTGVMLPCLSVVIAEELGLRSDVRRLPITEAGCAGGAAALARADDFVRAFPFARVLVIAVELPSLTLQQDDRSDANLVACALFGDGAAAALVQGAAQVQGAKQRATPGVEIVATHTEVLPGSATDLGFDLRDGGLHIVLSRNVPRIISQHVPRIIFDFMKRTDLCKEQLSFCVLHPGGRRVLDSLEHSLELEQKMTRVSRQILRDYGNQSSASVLFVLERTLAREGPEGYGLLAAFGPGITVELSLLRGHRC